MKHVTGKLLSFSLILCLLFPLVAYAEGQPSVSDLAAFFSADSDEEPTEQDKMIEPLIGIWYNKDVITGESVYIIGKNNYTDDYTNAYIVLNASVSVSPFNMNQIRAYTYTLTADKYEPNTYYFKNDNNMYRAVLNENELTVYLVDEFAGSPNVYKKLGN